MSEEGRDPHIAATARRAPKRRGPGLGLLLHLRFGREAPLTDELFAALAAENDALRLERTARGDLEIMAPAGGGASNKNFGLTTQLGVWAMHEGRGLGRCFDSSGGFVLPNGAIRSPDGSWISLARWEALTAEQRETFLPICPEFVIELRSRSDRPAKLRKKMKEYMDQGARLGWLIDPLTGKVEIYRAGQPVERLLRPETLSGEDVLPGFVLDLKGILAE